MEELNNIYKEDDQFVYGIEYSIGGKIGRRNVIITRLIWGLIYAEAVIFQIKNYHMFESLYHITGGKVIAGLLLFNLSYIMTTVIMCYFRKIFSEFSSRKYALFAPVSWLFPIDIIILGLHTWFYFYYWPMSMSL